MKNQTRSKIAIINTTVTLGGQILQIIIGFFLRKLFISSLGVIYLGYNSVFANILQMLNLADLGIGVAVTSYLYAPLGNRENDKIAALMHLYKKVYQIIGTVVLVIGISVSFFLKYLIPDAVDSYSFLRILFYLNLLGAVSTYFLAYKRTLLIADQKSYYTNFIDTITFIIISVLQAFSLLYFKNYVLYLVLNIGKNIISNLYLSISYNKEYGRIICNPSIELVKEYQKKIFFYLKDVFISRIGAVIFYGTDNIIISTIKGSLLAGYLSNYTMITTQITSVIGQVLASLQATFGNYVNSDVNLDEQRRMTDNYFCANYIIGNFCLVCFTLLAQPFVKTLYGEKLLLSTSTACWLGINLMLSMMIQLPSQVFTIYRLFRYDRPIIITSALLNIIISVVLVKAIGIDGALIGTFVTSLIYLFSRFFIIAKKVYGIEYWHYIKQILIYFTCSTICIFVTYYSTTGIEVSGWATFILKAALVAVIAFSSSCALLCWKDEFKFLITKLVPGRIRKYVKPAPILLLTAAIITASFLIGGTSVSDINPTNKSLVRTDTYTQDKEYGTKVFHFSMDDTIDVFADISSSDYVSLFQNEMLSWLKSLHDKYGVKITCFVMYENDNFSLVECSEKYRDEFIANSDWLRFGFHTRNGNTTYDEGNELIVDYQIWLSEMERIAGSSSIDNVVRLQSYKGNYENIASVVSLDDQPIVGLLTADDDRTQYYLADDVNKYIYSHDVYNDNDLGIVLISTDIRVEYISDIRQKFLEFNTDSWSNQLGYMEIFTHEWILNIDIRNKVEEFCKWAIENDYLFGFPEDIVNG